MTNCRKCCEFRSQRAEPLVPTSLPGLPWQKVATDLFNWKKLTYLLIVDYYSRWIEIARLESTTAACVIQHTSSIFVRHGIPEIAVSDNGPQYSSESFARFANDYGFHHATSSPYHPQGVAKQKGLSGPLKISFKKQEIHTGCYWLTAQLHWKLDIVRQSF